MKWLVLSFFLPSMALAIHCDCDVMVHPPVTGSHKMSPTRLKTLAGNEFSSYSLKNQLSCRESCEKTFQQDLPVERLNAVLLTMTQSLIDEGQLGYNCTGLTNLKYPVRVKARLGKQPLGNVVDQVHAVNHEEICFTP